MMLPAGQQRRAVDALLFTLCIACGFKRPVCGIVICLRRSICIFLRFDTVCSVIPTKHTGIFFQHIPKPYGESFIRCAGGINHQLSIGTYMHMYH
jgi:hypothetical protein